MTLLFCYPLASILPSTRLQHTPRERKKDCDLLPLRELSRLLYHTGTKIYTKQRFNLHQYLTLYAMQRCPVKQLYRIDSPWWQ